jgi:UDP-N-acetylmuramoyl-L-alanyl-D-glutamate--2,6-diaminopimelate ligase
MTRPKETSIALDVLVRSLEQEDAVRRIRVTGSQGQVSVVRITDDSRDVTADTLFVAIPGERADGHEFIEEAVERGAIAIVCERFPPVETRDSGVVWIQVDRSRRALSILAHVFYGQVAERLELIGITGTNGKTTTAYLTYHVLQELGIRPGLIGTLGVFVSDERRDLKVTTPGPLDVQVLWKEMEEAGCEVCVMELSSHALDQHRVDPRYFEVGVFTNLSHDHLDYHGDFDAYLRAKKRLFNELSEDAAAVYNADDPRGTDIIAHTRAKRFSYGLETSSDLRADLLENSLTGLQFRLGDYTIDSQLTGRFNVYNLLAAAGASRAVSSGTWGEIACALAGAPPVPGRLERIRFDDDTVVFVDYAHTPDALENVLETLRTAKSEASSLWCVFGCGGDRDRQKRPMMGRIAERLADFVVVTSDNPRTENPDTIIDEIIGGLEDPDAVVRERDRKRAIDYVARTAASGDVVLLAGKGHERYQVLKGETVAFDDREEVKRSFSTHRRTLISSG